MGKLLDLSRGSFVKQACLLYANGMTVKEIAKKLQVPLLVARMVVTLHGLSTGKVKL